MKTAHDPLQHTALTSLFLSVSISQYTQTEDFGLPSLHSSVHRHPQEEFSLPPSPTELERIINYLYINDSISHYTQPGPSTQSCPCEKKLSCKNLPAIHKCALEIFIKIHVQKCYLFHLSWDSSALEREPFIHTISLLK